MCNHAYGGDYPQHPLSMGKQCPYTDFYEKSLPAMPGAAGLGHVSELPKDDRGTCIFHSLDVAWKRKNDFTTRFLELVRLLDAVETKNDYNYYDFREFVFSGNDVRTKKDVERYAFLIKDVTFRKQAYFTGASFVDEFDLDGVNFPGGMSFDRATFARDVIINNSSFNGLDFSKAAFTGRAFFTKVDFLSFSLFGEAMFTGIADGYGVLFEDVRFEGITDFSNAAFTSSVGFVKARFEDFANFRGTRFEDQAVFSDVSFQDVTEFIDASFETVRSVARYRGAAVEFNRIDVTKDAVLTFKSTDSQRKMFNHDVQFSFREDPAGTIQFENANFSQIKTDSRDRLMRLAKMGRVEIGPGCIKYRFQTGVRTLSVSEGNATLILELCQTFINYFTVSNGFNLGFEIVERGKTHVSFFYFTDEDIPEDTFLDRLAHTERSLWNLLFISSDEHLLAQAPAGAELSTTRESAVINAVDGISALLGTFFRVGARIALGKWKESDTNALLGAIRFNEHGSDDRARSLHRVLVARYTGETLFGINRQQNEILAPMVPPSGKLLTPARVRILFLGANSSFSPLELDREIDRIQTNLKLAKERDALHLHREWAVTVDNLLQAILDESPTIVHFSGHGEDVGIILQNEIGEPTVVPADALSNLFKLFKDTVCCVVLNSCFSEHQARAIRQHIPHVIGMSGWIPEPAALAFSTGFYKAIGAGRDIPFAFALGKAAMQLLGVFGDDVPVLL